MNSAAVEIHFAPLTHADLPRIATWFNEPRVQRWYARGQRTLEEVTARYTPNIERAVPTRCFLMHFDGVAAGFIKTYRLEDYPAYAAKLDAQDGWAGIDFCVGEPTCRGRGWARHWLRQFLEEVVFADPAIRACVAGPDPENQASVGALRSAGFRFLRQVTMPGEDPDEALHILERPVLRP